MSLKSKYIDQMKHSILKIDPSLNEEELEHIIEKTYDKKLRNPTVYLENDIRKEEVKSDLVHLCEWIDKKNPVVSGNATFYCQPEVSQSPTSNMLRALKKERKSIKGEMFQYKETDYQYQSLDLSQQNVKVIMNAEYGGSGVSVAAFYNKFGPAATTLLAQSIITTMAAFFEGFIGNNNKFYTIDECVDWLNIVTKKDAKVHDWIEVPDKEECIKHLKKKFILYDVANDPVLEGYINHLSDQELIYVYYANNLNEFVGSHEKVGNLLQNILTALPNYQAATKVIPDGFSQTTVKEYNTYISQEMFLNPYKPPETIQKYVAKLSKYLEQYIYVQYFTNDSIVKLNNHKRNTVILVDTDSNILNTNLFVQYVNEHVLSGNTFGRTQEYNDMIIVNTLAYCISSYVADILNAYGVIHNVNDEYRKELAMKNEFLFSRLLILNKKKRYCSSMVLREGNILAPYKIDIKGVDFATSNVTDEVTERFTYITKRYILQDELDLAGLVKAVKNFEKEIYDDLKSGHTTYLKPKGYKDEAAYKDAWRIQVYKAGTMWNLIYPENKIYSLDKVKLIKLKIRSEADLEKIKDKYPVEYQAILTNIYQSQNPQVLKNGLKVIAIPLAMKEIPEWIQEFIDYKMIISDIVASYRSVLEALEVNISNVKTPTGKVLFVDPVIKL